MQGTGDSSSGSPCRTSLVSRLHYLGHENSVLSVFVGAELDPRGHGLSHLKPGVNIGEQISVSCVSYYGLINGPDCGQI
jgi:hypothetical protein